MILSFSRNAKFKSIRQRSEIINESNIRGLERRTRDISRDPFAEISRESRRAFHDRPFDTLGVGKRYRVTFQRHDESPQPARINEATNTSRATFQ